MKKLFAKLGAALAICSCAHTSEGPALMKSEDFDVFVEGKKVSLYTLHKGGIYLQVTNFGGRVVSVFTQDRNGKWEDLVLGHNNINDYVNYPGERFLGAVVGTCANRIASGTYTIDGVKYEFPQNNGVNTLHGGLTGIDLLVWDVKEVDDEHIVLSVVHPDGLDGFPGNVEIEMTYTLTDDNEWRIDYKATTDKATHVNLANHPFFNLKGEGNGTILDNILYINASATTPINDVMIPTGEIAPVDGTPFDFRTPHAIGDRIGDDNDQLRYGGGYDHNWVLDKPEAGAVTLACSVYEPTTGRFLEVFTDQPGMQVYSGNFFTSAENGKTGKPLAFRESLALETQKFPDTPNQKNFPSTLLRPGEVYTQVCIYKFSVK